MNLGAHPLFMIHSEGTENDKTYAHFLIQIAELLGISCGHLLMDAGHDSLDLHALIFVKIYAKTLILQRKSAKLPQFDSEKAITE